MRDGWIETTLGELCEIYQPETISKAQMDDTAPYIVYGANGPVGRYSRFNHEEPEVVVTCRGATCGVVNITPPNCWITGNAMVVKPRDNRSIKGFLFWALQTSVDVQATISGSAQPQITRTGLAPSKIQVPPLVEQKRIVDLVSSADAYIDALQQHAETARIALNAVLNELLSAGGDDWTKSTLGDIAQWQGGITPSMANNEFWENGTIPWVSSGDVLRLNLRGAQKFVTEISLKETSLKLLPVGAVVVVVRSGVLIHTLPIAILESPSTINQDIKAGIPRSNVLGQFLLWVLRSNSRVILESCRKTGTTVQSISTDAFLKFPVLLPPLDEQKRIVEIVSSMNEVLQSAENAVAVAKNLRSGLLSDLLSGNHEIPTSYDSLVGAA